MPYVLLSDEVTDFIDIWRLGELDCLPYSVSDYFHPKEPL
jgi:hypothetical protein